MQTVVVGVDVVVDDNVLQASSSLAYERQKSLRWQRETVVSSLG